MAQNTLTPLDLIDAYAAVTACDDAFHHLAAWTYDHRVREAADLRAQLSQLLEASGVDQ